jgi:DNA-binding response OmpR family regulator
VTDGEAALEAVRRLHPRVVVLDVMLPKRSGFEVLKQIRADVLTSRQPVLILTAKGQQQDRRIAEELGADSFVTKPYANAEVVGEVRRLLGEDAKG